MRTLLCGLCGWLLVSSVVLDQDVLDPESRTNGNGKTYSIIGRQHEILQEAQLRAVKLRFRALFFK